MKLLVAFLVVAFVSLPLSAQVPTSSSEFRPNFHEDAYTRGALELKRMASCAVERRDGLANSMLESLPGSRSETLIIDKMMDVMVNCMRRLRPAMRVDHEQLRGAVAEELYLAAHPRPVDFAAFDHSDKSLPPEWISSELEAPQLSRIVWQDFAQCVVSDAPMQADAMLRTAPRSAEEAAAIEQIMRYLGPCVGDGSTFKMDAAALRSHVAQALNRGMAMWPLVASPAGK